MMARQRSPGWWYPYIFVALFLVVVVVNGIMAYFATTTFSGLETEHAYDRGVAYNRTIAQEEEQRRLGWSVGLTVVRPSGEAGARADVSVSIRDRDGRPLDGAGVTADIRRPTDSRHDRTAVLPARGNGAYGALVDLPLPGQWDVRIRAEHGTASHLLRQRVSVP